MGRGTTRKQPYLVFISHSAKDRWIARQVAGIIDKKGKPHGIKTFLDEKDIEGGDSIPEAIRDNLQKCSEFIVLLTPNSYSRQWVLIEIGAAWGQRKHVVAIVNQVPPTKIPNVISLDKAIDLNSLDEYIQQLMNRARKRKGKS